MPEPLVVMIPHRLGKAEALSRIKAGLGRAEAEFARLINFEHQHWDGDRLSFSVSALGQRAIGFLDVYEGAVRLRSRCRGCWRSSPLLRNG